MTKEIRSLFKASYWRKRTSVTHWHSGINASIREELLNGTDNLSHTAPAAPYLPFTSVSASLCENISDIHGQKVYVLKSCFRHSSRSRNRLFDLEENCKQMKFGEVTASVSSWDWNLESELGISINMPLGGATTNQTLLLALLDRCRQAILKEIETNHQDSRDNTSTTAPTSTAVSTTSRQSYDNAYFYILFVMFFYSFLSLALFKGFVQYDDGKRDPYKEFMTPLTPQSKNATQAQPLTKSTLRRKTASETRDMSV